MNVQATNFLTCRKINVNIVSEKILSWCLYKLKLELVNDYMLYVPPVNDARWQDVVTGKTQINIEFFPLKLLLARQRLQLQTSTNPKILEVCVYELRQLFVKNQNHPIAMKDLKKIFGRKRLFRRLFRRD